MSQNEQKILIFSSIRNLKSPTVISHPRGRGRVTVFVHAPLRRILFRFLYAAGFSLFRIPEIRFSVPPLGFEQGALDSQQFNLYFCREFRSRHAEDVHRFLIKVRSLLWNSVKRLRSRDEEKAFIEFGDDPMRHFGNRMGRLSNGPIRFFCLWWIMRRYLSVVILLILCTTSATAQTSVGLSATRQHPNEIVIRFEPMYTHVPVLTSEGRERVRIRFAGEMHDDLRSGMPILPHIRRSVDLLTASARIEIVESAYEERQHVDLLKYPVLVKDEEFGAAHEYGAVREMESTGRRDLAELVDVARSGDRFVGTVRINPVQYDPARRVVRFYTKVVVRVMTQGTESPRVAESVLQDSPLRQGDWYRMDVKDEGIYRIDRAFLQSAGIPASLFSNINAVRIFGNGGRMLPEDLLASRPAGLQEVARHVVDRNGNGQFDTDDYILFYGQSTRGWDYSAKTKTFSHVINHYTETNRYFITFAGPVGKGMDSIASISLPGAIRPPDFQGREFVEEERFNLFKSGRQWYGQIFDPSASSAVIAISLPGIDTSKAVTYRIVLLSRAAVDESFKIEEGNSLLGRISTFGVDVASIEYEFAYVTPVSTFTRRGPLQDSRSLIRVTYELQSTASRAWLDWIEILYRRRFNAVNDLLAFATPDTTGVVEYALSNFSSRDVLVFDVSDHSGVRRITGLTMDPLETGRFSFQMSQSAGSVREIIAVGPNGFKTPSGVQKVENSNLYGITTGAEFIIVTPKEFVAEAQRLKSHREARDSLTVIIAEGDQVFNEFSGGITDPMAVRDFLYRAYTTWKVKAKYVLLFGDGHFDYKSISTTARNWIPPYQTSESIHQILSYASDDHFVMLNPANPRVSLAIGRLAANSVKEATIVVDKIIRYETQSATDPWRNRVTYVADDGLTSTRDEGSIHTYQSEILAQHFTPPSIEKRKIFIIEYPTTSSASGRRKPEANRAIIDAINRGTLIINYTGHGNPQLWAHEAIFTREASLPQLTNRDRLMLLVAATCDFARYDNPSEQSAGEEIITMERGGAIGVITASRPVYSFENSQFNNSYYAELFTRDANGRMPTLGDAMFRTKQLLYSVNDVKYHLLADPTMRLAAPPILASVDSVNGKSLRDVVEVQTLGKADVAGTILNQHGTRWNEFNGRAIVEVYDSKRTVTVAEWGNFSFDVNGSLLYRGEVTVSNGRFRSVVPIPKDVSYDNNRARIAVYGWTSASDVVGYTESVWIAGTDTSAAKDTTGPRIEVFLGRESFRPGDVVPPDVMLYVKLQDVNGINTSTAGVGHRLEASLPTLQRSIDLSDYYRSDLDTYQSGTVSYPMTQIPEGRHSVLVKAWDTHNNSSELETFFEVRAESMLDLYHVYNFPNPFRSATMFTFQRSSGEPIDVEVKIYTPAGRLIEAIRRFAVNDQFVQIPWDGRDRDGNEVANGLYFYKIIVRSFEEGRSKEVIGKLSVLR